MLWQLLLILLVRFVINAYRFAFYASLTNSYWDVIVCNPIVWETWHCFSGPVYLYEKTCSGVSYLQTMKLFHKTFINRSKQTFYFQNVTFKTIAIIMLSTHCKIILSYLSMSGKLTTVPEIHKCWLPWIKILIRAITTFIISQVFLIRYKLLPYSIN